MYRALVWSLLLAALPALASAQSRLTEGATMPPTSAAAPQGALALELDPAAIGYLGSLSAVVAHSRAPRGGDVQDGTLAYVGGAYRGLGLALGLDRQRGHGLSDRGRFSLGIAYAPSRRFAFGLAYRKVVFADARDLSTFDLAMNVRPSSRVALSLVLRDVLGPSGVGRSGIAFPMSVAANAAFRPFRTDFLTLEGGVVVHSTKRVDGRIFAAIAVPRLGRLFSVVYAEDVFEDPRFGVNAGLELALGGLGVGSGVLVREGADDAGYYLTGRFDAGAPGGLIRPDYIAKLEVSGEVSARRILTILATLDRAARDPDVRGVLLELRRTDLGLAYAQELRQMVAFLEARGKKVLCYMESPSGGEFYACAAASKRYVDEAGTLRLVGPSLEVLHFGALLRRLGVRFDMVRAGRFKSMPERLTLDAPSTDADAQSRALLGDLHTRLVADLARDLSVGRDAVQRLVDGGPYSGRSAVTMGLVHGTADRHELNRLVRELHGRRVPVHALRPYRAHDIWGDPPRIAVVVLDGNIVDGDNRDVPFIGLHSSGSDDIVRTLERLRSDDSVGAVVLRVDSGGGSALASHRIDRAVRRLRDAKPVVASFGAMAASGGYLAASGASTIVAVPATVTGSIGVFYGKVDASELAERLGLRATQYRNNAHAGATSVYRAFTESERERLGALVDEAYEHFVERVASGRGLGADEVEAVAEGRVFSGDAAVANGLVDALGGFGDALHRARVLADLGYDAEVVYLPRRPGSLLEYLAASGDHASTSAVQVFELPPTLQAFARALASALACEEAGLRAMVPWSLD